MGMALPDSGEDLGGRSTMNLQKVGSHVRKIIIAATPCNFGKRLVGAFVLQGKHGGMTPQQTQIGLGVQPHILLENAAELFGTETGLVGQISRSENIPGRYDSRQDEKRSADGEHSARRQRSSAGDEKRNHLTTHSMLFRR